MRTIKTSELYAMDIVLNSFNVSSPSPVHNREEIPGRNGFIDLGTTYGGRVIDAKITILPIDNKDYALLRNEVFSLFDSREPFYLIHDELGKRWLVKYNSTYSFSRTANIGETPIQFMSPNAFAESIGTTLDLFTFDTELWQIGQGLNEDMTALVEKTTTWFDIGHKKWGEL